MPREILIHLNVTPPEGDERPVEEITEAVMGALGVGSDDPSVVFLDIVVAHAEEV